MKALVTGGAGFIGSHLALRLLEGGHQAVVVDDLSAGRVDHLDRALERYGFLLRIVDLLDADALSDCFTGVDWVFHLAGYGDAREARRRPKRALEAHVQATLQVLECARHFRAKAFVYAASATCYGLDAPVPTPEIAPTSPCDPLAITKHLGEQLVLDWSRLYDLPAMSLRLFDVYGARAPLTPRWGPVASVFLAQRASGAPLTVAGDGAQTRDFVHVDDVTRAMILAAQQPQPGEVFNIGSGVGTSITRLAELVGGPWVSVPARPGDVRQRTADVRRAHERLDWRAEIDIEEGIQRLLHDLDAWRNAPVWTPEFVTELHQGAPAPATTTPPSPSPDPAVIPPPASPAPPA
ncbi:MAG: NAD-dependent epimerase/dehydratase family protein [Myxococcota bacterium]